MNYIFNTLSNLQLAHDQPTDVKSAHRQWFKLATFKHLDDLDAYLSEILDKFDQSSLLITALIQAHNLLKEMNTHAILYHLVKSLNYVAYGHVLIKRVTEEVERILTAVNMSRVFTQPLTLVLSYFIEAARTPLLNIEFDLNRYCKWLIFMHTVVADSQLTFLMNVSDNNFIICSVSTKTI